MRASPIEMAGWVGSNRKADLHKPGGKHFYGERHCTHSDRHTQRTWEDAVHRGRLESHMVVLVLVCILVSAVRVQRIAVLLAGKLVVELSSVQFNVVGPHIRGSLSDGNRWPFLQGWRSP